MTPIHRPNSLVDQHGILLNCSEQLLETAMAVRRLVAHQWHNISRVLKDMKEVFLQIFLSKDKRQQNFTFVDALADVTFLNLEKTGILYEVQDMYFSVTILLIALTLGEIIGNLWTEFAWAPQLAVHQALTVILLLPLQLSVERIHETIKHRRCDLYIKIFFIGFSMGRLCDYNLMLNAPKIICPMVFSVLIDKFGDMKDDASDLQHKQIKSHRYSSPIHLFVNQEESRLELFIGLALTVNAIVWLFYYGLRQLLLEKSTIQQPIWSFGSTNPWLANADLVYVFCVLAFDVFVSVI
uniref:XK-related protein n=1 Tax=Meloidogyne hapla TaxID=6305 RepID=A0A1I8BS86_MELHA